MQHKTKLAHKIQTPPNSIKITSKTQPNKWKGEDIHSELKMLYECRETTNNKYLKIIEELQKLVESLLKKNDFLMRDRNALLRENNSLRMKCESLNGVLQMKNLLGGGYEEDELFTILVQNKGITSAQPQSQPAEDNIQVQQNQSPSQENGFHCSQLLISRNPLSFDISQNEQCQISITNMNIRNETLMTHNVQTPGLPNESIYIQCSSSKPEGAIRSFYLCLIQNRILSKLLSKNIYELKQDHTVTLFEPYPTNQFWVSMLIQFLQLIQQGKFEGQSELLEYIKVHSLIDTLLVKCLKSRIEFVFSQDGQGSAELTQIFTALANEFSMRMELQGGQFLFYMKEFKDQNLLLSQKASLQISLNNKQQSKYYVREEEPCFHIFHENGLLQFKFFVPLENQMALSQYEINEQNGDLNAFSLSEQNGSDQKQIQSNHQNKGEDEFDGVSNILNQQDINIFQRSQNLQMRKANKKYNQTEMLYCEGDVREALKSSRFFKNRVNSQNESNFGLRSQKF